MFIECCTYDTVADFELRRPVVAKYEPTFERNLPLISSAMRSDPEDGGNTFLRNYMTSHLTRP
jgi:hypothetical protein